MELTCCELQTLLSPPSNENPTFAKEGGKTGQLQNRPKPLRNSLESLIFMPPKFTNQLNRTVNTHGSYSSFNDDTVLFLFLVTFSVKLSVLT